MNEGEIAFKIIADKSMTRGFAVLIVSYEDYSKMQSMGWNMEKPNGEYKENLIRFKPVSDQGEPK